MARAGSGAGRPAHVSTPACPAWESSWMFFMTHFATLLGHCRGVVQVQHHCRILLKITWWFYCYFKAAIAGFKSDWSSNVGEGLLDTLHPYYFPSPNHTQNSDVAVSPLEEGLENRFPGNYFMTQEQPPQFASWSGCCSWLGHRFWVLLPGTECLLCFNSSTDETIVTTPLSLST